jgi:hypothetical protein
MFVFSGVMVLILTVYANSLVRFSMETMEYNIEQRLIATAQRAVGLTTAEELNSFRDGSDMAKPEYAALKQKLLD